jgi:hypothetical protein
MRRRRFMFASLAVFALGVLLGASANRTQAEEFFTADAAVAAEASVADSAVHSAPVPDGVVEDAGCVGDPYGAGGGPFGLHPLTCIPRDYLNPHLFYNFYVGGNCGSIPAAMYPTPMPTPPLVGHTYFTYQPLYPHEFMYAHKRVYHHHYNHNRGLTRTRVIWAW